VSAATCASDCPTAMSRSCWPNAAWRSITSPSNGGCSASRRCSLTPARPSRHTTGDRWFVDETYVKVAGRWRYLYRAVDQYGQVIDVLVSEQRDSAAPRQFFTRALTHGPSPVEVTTDRAAAYLRVLDELFPRPRTSPSSTSRMKLSRPFLPPGQLPDHAGRSRGQGWPEATVGVALTPVRTGVASWLVGVVDPVAKSRDLGLSPAAPLGPSRAWVVAPRWRRPRPPPPVSVPAAGVDRRVGWVASRR